MRVAYLGNFEPPHSTENEMRKAIEANGHDVLEIQEGATKAIAVPEIAAEADVFLWTQTYGLAVSGGTLEERRDMVARLRAKGIPTVGYHLDKWWGLEREEQLRSGEPFFHVDRLCTADGGDWPWADLGIEHRWFPPGVSEFECGGGEVRRELTAPITFVGNHSFRKRPGGGWDGYHEESTHRRELVQWLQRTYKGKARFWQRPGRPAVRGQALRDLYASAQVIVGDSCLVGHGAVRYWSDRIPETIGRGGFLLHPYVEGIEEHYTDGKHLRLWEAGDWTELRRLLDHYLRNEEERRAIAEEGRRHVLETATYTVRVRQLFEMLTDEGLM